MSHDMRTRIVSCSTSPEMALNYVSPSSSARITISDSGDGTKINIELPALNPASKPLFIYPLDLADGIF